MIRFNAFYLGGNGRNVASETLGLLSDRRGFIGMQTTNYAASRSRWTIGRRVAQPIPKNANRTGSKYQGSIKTIVVYNNFIITSCTCTEY